MSLEFLSPSTGALARSPMERPALAAGGELEQRDGWNVAVRFDGEDAERARCQTSVGFADLSHLGKIEVQAGPDEPSAIASEILRSGAGRPAPSGETHRSGAGQPAPSRETHRSGAGQPAPSRETLELGQATRFDDGWWCSYTAERAVALCEPGALPGLRERLQDAAAALSGLASVIDVSTAFGALALHGPLARETFARFTALDLRDVATPPGSFRPGSVARTPGAILRESEQRWLMLFGAALGQYVWTVVADAAEHLGGGPVGVDVLEALGAVARTKEAQPSA